MNGFASAQRAFEAPPDDLPDGEVECPSECTDEDTGKPDPDCSRCEGKGWIYEDEHPDWCNRCGLTGRCPDCDPPEREDRW